MIRQDVGGYKVLSLHLKEESESIHYIYVREHKVREKTSEKPEGRTLFAIGVPPYATKESLENGFSIFDTVEAVYLQASPSVALPPVEISKIFKDHPQIKGFKIAYIVFASAVGVSNALSRDVDRSIVLSSSMYQIPMGISKWCSEYNYKAIIDTRSMDLEINNYIFEYDKNVEEEEKRLKHMSEPDDDGWVTVTTKGRKPGISRKESVVTNIKEKEEKKRSRKELLNFYRFQIRESKMNHLMKLREKFAEDKRRIAMLKQSRKFKPF